MARLRQLPMPSQLLQAIDRIAPTSMIPVQSNTIIPNEIIERRPILPPVVSFAPRLPKNIDRRRSQFEEIPYDLSETLDRIWISLSRKFIYCSIPGS